MTRSLSSVGIVGIGAMGAPMARNLQRRGLAPAVHDIDPAALAAARADGLPVCASAAVLASRCDAVVIVVVDAGQVDAVLAGPDGVLHASRPRDAPRQAVIVCSTIAAADMERFGATVAARGIDFVDAPISGGPARAADGSLSMMVAAEDPVWQRCEALLRAMASTIVPLGPRIGDASRMKLVNNLLAGINLVAGAEAMALGEKLGLPRQQIFDLITASSGASWMFADRMARVLKEDTVPRARTAILAKDLSLAVQMAAEAGMATPMGEQALAVFRATVAAGLGDADDASVLQTYRNGM